jgi:hypothetical protein
VTILSKINAAGDILTLIISLMAVFPIVILTLIEDPNFIQKLWRDIKDHWRNA